jgi:integrase/recombinase XerD
MNTLREAVEEYVIIRRGLGTELRLPAAALRRFVEFLEHEKSDFITTELALRWAQQPVRCRPSTWADRLDVVRRFAAWRSATDPRTEIPPRRLLPHRRRRNAPHIYTDEEIVQIMTEASRLPSPKGASSPDLRYTFRAACHDRAATGRRDSS